MPAALALPTRQPGLLSSLMELTKLRIEHDTLKNQVRLMEKELEFLTRRERAVERRLVP